MNADNYFTRHLPPRVNFLTTFRETYRRTSAKPGRPELNSQEARDFFRCSKDIAVLMVRSFCGEMGLYLPKEGQGQKGGTALEAIQNWQPRFKGLPFTEVEAQSDPVRYQKLLVVMKAANWAVTQTGPMNVGHLIAGPKEEEELCEVIDWVEELIDTKLYKPDGRSLKEAMGLPDNVMIPLSGK